MRHLSEYRNQKIVSALLDRIYGITTRPWALMEICGGQTHSLVRNGILDMLPPEITMIHGPGCPVCVTPVHMIDKAIHLALDHGVTICSFGDMLRVPGSDGSLQKAKARGADIRTVYSPLEALKLAQKEPEMEVAFFAVGFETTAPANALAVVEANLLGVRNFSILASHVLVPPAMEAILTDPDNLIDGFLAAGHVCTVMGTRQYEPLAERFRMPIVITGFEPVDLLQGILSAISQLEEGRYQVENQYRRVVSSQGNLAAQSIIDQVFEPADADWRGLGSLPLSGYRIRPQFSQFDAAQRYRMDLPKTQESNECKAGEVLKGLLKPYSCPHFGKKCTPANPLGAPMVSSEGACAAYFNYSNIPLGK